MEEQVPSLPCPVGEEPECKDMTARLQYVKVGNCRSEEEVDIHYCQVRGWRGEGVAGGFSFRLMALVTLCADLGNSQGREVKGTRVFFVFDFLFRANVSLM